MPVPGYGVSSAIPRGGNRFYICAMDLFNYHRRSTTEVHIGNTPLGGSNPIRIQSMTNTHTHETEPCVEQCIRIIDAGADYVRLTAQGTREAENLACIEDELHRRGYHTPLVADIHFNPHVADIAAGIVEKVRINPGNFVDSARTFKHIDYTDEEYAAELQRLRNRLIQLLEICRKHHTAIRIGVNHGSLSDRIMSRYGDTPEGIVESCMEFLRVCRDENFTDVVISIKASNTVVMVKSVRLLLAALEKGNMHYPLHLGVTEAGEGEDGRIKSAVGIGTLLADGIGDTIRVSLSEAPEAEIPVARKLVDYITARAQHPHINGVKADAYDFLHMERRSSKAVHNIGGGKVPVIISDHLSDVSDGNLQPDFLYIEKDNEIISNLPANGITALYRERITTAGGLRCRDKIFATILSRTERKNLGYNRKHTGNRSYTDFATHQSRRGMPGFFPCTAPPEMHRSGCRATDLRRKYARRFAIESGSRLRSFIARRVRRRNLVTQHRKYPGRENFGLYVWHLAGSPPAHE